MKIVWPVLFLLCLAGCKKQPAIAGKWLDQINSNYAVSYEFRADGTYTQTYLDQKGPRGTTTGNYKVDGDKLTVTNNQSTRARDGKVTKMVDEVLLLKFDGDTMEIQGQNPMNGNRYETLSKLKRQE